MRCGMGLIDVHGRNLGRGRELDRLFYDLLDLNHLDVLFRVHPLVPGEDPLLWRAQGGNSGRNSPAQVPVSNVGRHRVRDTASLCLYLYPKPLLGPCHVPGPCQHNPALED